MKILQINSSINIGSSGRIVEDIGEIAIRNGFQSYIAYSRGKPIVKTTQHIKIGNKLNNLLHGIKTILFDRHGFGSEIVTKRLVEEIKLIKPDIVHLHNLHGYYLNIKVLFEYLAKSNVHVVWTLHDCWSFTGHCAHYENIGCEKWKTQCYSCPKKIKYPKSIFLDNSKNNYLDKKSIFTSISNLTIVTPSDWLKRQVEMSYLKGFRALSINNGVDLKLFNSDNVDKNRLIELHQLKGLKIVLCVANNWSSAKGLQDVITFSNKIDKQIKIVIVGVTSRLKKKLPSSIISIEKTTNLNELAAWYSIADVFLNPTYMDTFPTTNLEALACGTPVISYRTGGSPEAISNETGIIIEKGDIEGLLVSVKTIIENGKEHYGEACRDRAKQLYEKEKQFEKYIELYKEILKIG